MQYQPNSLDPTLPQPNMSPPFPPVSFRSPSRAPWLLTVAVAGVVAATQIEARAMSKLRHPSADVGARELLEAV